MAIRASHADLANLLDNAAKYQDRGGTVTVEVLPAYAVVAVRLRGARHVGRTAVMVFDVRSRLIRVWTLAGQAGISLSAPGVAPHRTAGSRVGRRATRTRVQGSAFG